VQQHLDRHLKMLCPAARISHRWAGTMGFSPDGLPLAGPVPQIPGAHFIGGYTGHGMGFAFNLARIYVDNLFGSARVPEWLRLERAL
jgi:glycine/D-amino acid oxidase-like deaminating enzyme